MKDELNAQEAAASLGVSVTTLYALIKRGLLEKHKKPYGIGAGGRRFFFLRSDVEKLKRGKTN